MQNDCRESNCSYRPRGLSVWIPPRALVIHVVNPVAYLAQKVLSVGGRQNPSDRGKDWLYIFQTLAIFSENLETLNRQTPELLPNLSKNQRVGILRSI
jgi:hypothetical protein